MPPGEHFVAAKDYVPKEKAFPMWVSLTTFHGVKDWHASQHCCSFFVWAILILCSMSACLYQVAALIHVYLSSTHYVSSLYVVQNQFPPFPNVTICNLNRVNATAMAELKLKPEAVVFLFAASMSSYDFGLVEPKDINNSSDAWDAFLKRNDISSELKDPANLLEYLGHKCEPTFISCHFGGDRFDCCNHATKIINKDYGLCWTIKPPLGRKGIVTQDLPGIANGLQMFLLPNTKEYLSSDVFLNNYLENGMVVSIDYNPYRMIFPDPFRIDPGRHVHISLDALTYKWDIPFPVVFQPDCNLSAQLKILKGPYDHLNCVSDCMQQYIHYKCECLLISEHKTDYRTCDGKDLLRCFNLTNNLKLMEKKTFHKCLTNCKAPCNTTWEIKSTPSFNAYPQERFLESMAAKIQEDKMKILLTREELQSMINLNIFFPSRGYTAVERHQRTSLLELVSNIGGQTGLWVGASVITLFQAFYYLGYGAFRICYYGRGDSGADANEEVFEEAQSSTSKVKPIARIKPSGMEGRQEEWEQRPKPGSAWTRT